LAVFFNIHSEHSEKISESGGVSSINHPNALHSMMTEAELNINHLQTNRRLLFLKTQSVPRSKHFSSRL